jgi:hypothetical protein
MMCDPDAQVTARPDEDEPRQRDVGDAGRAEELEDGSLDPDELDGEPAWRDHGSDDET